MVRLLVPHAIGSADVTGALAKARAALLAERNAEGHWEGELSASALSTATACVALKLSADNGSLPASTAMPFVERGLAWLAKHQNPDGGWGDTVLSHSNISTTALCWAALGCAGEASAEFTSAERRASQWLTSKIGSTDPEAVAQALLARYGDDRTFSVPILTHCAVSGRLGCGEEAWQHVIPLPFEIAACPPQLFAALRMPVVSYALPALIAIGYARHVHAPSKNVLIRWLRRAVTAKVLRTLDRIQPTNGGFLEATPLTSFVVMSLVASGQAQHPVARRGIEFLLRSAQPDGCWRIDTNLATWCSTLAINALGGLNDTSAKATTEWLLQQQYRQKHLYTNAAPGGWAWTNLPGGVPDADDTAGALLALHRLGNRNVDAARAGVRWLLGLQNSDGGVPTFCRGWGHLPFDHSSADITAHAVRAWCVWQDDLPSDDRPRIRHGIARALSFLERAQEPSGAWAPLWFGNQHEPDEANRVYGTSRVLLALADTASLPAAAGNAAAWLVATQKEDGGWSGGSASAPASTEETALAVEAVAAWHQRAPSPATAQAIAAGAAWLVARVHSGEWRDPSPIGFYFAKLWYFERLYPLIFTVAALERVAALNNAGS